MKKFILVIILNLCGFNLFSQSSSTAKCGVFASFIGTQLGSTSPRTIFIAQGDSFKISAGLSGCSGSCWITLMCPGGTNLGMSGCHYTSPFLKDSGMYTVVGSTSGGDFGVDGLRIAFSTQTSISEIINSEFKIFPNPAISETNVQLSENIKVWKMSIRGADGRIFSVINGNNGGLLRLDLSNFGAGYYLVDLEVDNNHYFKKLLVQN